MSDIELTAAIPVLPVDDVSKALAFYRDRLGFETAFEFGPYAGVVRGPISIHLDGGGEANPYPHPTCCRIDVRGVDALAAEMEGQGVIHPDEPLADTPFGMRQFSVLDPSGNRITFAEPLQR